MSPNEALVCHHVTANPDDKPMTHDHKAQPQAGILPLMTCMNAVGDTGIEPVTSSV
jgi:hypothetical protein